MENRAGGRKKNKDRCQRAVVMPELIHSAARPLPAYRQKEEGVGAKQEMDPLGNGPCTETVRLTDKQGEERMESKPVGCINIK